MIRYLNQQDLLDLRNFKAESISHHTLEKISLISRKIRKDILSMINNAGSGHVGGSLSSADIYLMLWLCADITIDNFNAVRDRIVISHGHTSSALYSVLGNFGFFDVEEAIRKYRKQDSVFEGHPNCNIPGVEWCSGSLGQGLSVGCGFALASRLQSQNKRVYVVMSDGEQQKGQITEAREFAARYRLSNLTAIIDYNGLQASGKLNDIMPCDITKKYESSGWKVISIDGHNFSEIYSALRTSRTMKESPVLILAHTIMGKGVSFIENKYEYHGRVLTKIQFEQALIEQGDIGKAIPSSPGIIEQRINSDEHCINIGTPVTYNPGNSVDCRSAAGVAIYDIVKNNSDVPVVVMDCDLYESLKTGAILKDFPDKFIECGIQEHNAITVAGALSKAGILVFFPSFAVFGIDETFGQNRMNDINGTSIKLINTHCGLDVGEDGKTHQCIDYISLNSNIPGYKLIIPADANHTDHIIRYIASEPGNFVVAMGRSPIPVLGTVRNGPYFSKDYSFVYGKADWIKEGKDATVISTGTMISRAVRASEELLEENMKIGVLNISCPKDIDIDKVIYACKTGVVIVYEDHLIQTGLGSLIASIIAEYELKCHFKKMGIVKYGKSCSAEEQYSSQNLDIDSLKDNIRLLVKQNLNKLISDKKQNY